MLRGILLYKVSSGGSKTITPTIRESPSSFGGENFQAFAASTAASFINDTPDTARAESTLPSSFTATSTTNIFSTPFSKKITEGGNVGSTRFLTLLSNSSAANRFGSFTETDLD